MASQRWSEEDIERAKVMRRNEGMTFEQIGKHFGRSRQAIYDLFVRYETASDHFERQAKVRDERKALMTKLVAEGKRRGEIAAAMGLKPKYASALLQQFGLKPTYARSWWTPANAAKVSELLSAGFSNAYICTSMKVSKGTLLGHLFRLKNADDPNHKETIARNAASRQERDSQIRELALKGKRTYQISIELGLTRGVVRHVLERLGIKIAPRVAKKRRHTPVLKIRTQPHGGTGYVTDPRDLEIPIYQRKTQDQLNYFTCRFPVNDPDKPDFFFCGAMPQLGSSYCPHHHARCYQSEYAMAEAA